ncbi:MAG: strawberry notch C-terminal domain-containing protein, partial [Flavisolibacter sp.]
GQMMRRERSFEGIEVNYDILEEKAQEHKAIADNITDILRDIIAFQGSHVDKMVEDLDKIAVAEGKEVEIREGTSQAGVDNMPYFSKIFQVINQMLFSLKADAVADKTIERLKDGKKVVIAFASTMGSFIETMENEQGMPVSDGDTINADFTEVLKRGLEGILRYTEKDMDGNPIYKKFSITDLSPDAQMEYHRIMEKIKSASTGITISPIDAIIQKLKQAGFSVAEVTGRKYELQLNPKGSKALVLSRKRINTNDAFRRFNNNEVDVLMINQAGSTGASAHAIPTAKVPKEQVKQRVMIVLQAELDISTEVQKRGRINRTGQILKPIYDYVTSAIPAEKRLMMMLQKKLKSLDANTTSNQKQSAKILDVPDFLNKYGDKIVTEYLLENPKVNDLLDDPLHLDSSDADSSTGKSSVEDAAMRVSGRVAVLSTEMQEEFYNEIAERYNDYVEYLKQVDEYDLEVEAMNLEAETITSKVFKMGKGGESAFGDDSLLETVRANVLKKPFTKTELDNLIIESLKGQEAIAQQRELISEYTSETDKRLEELKAETNARYDLLIQEIPGEKKIKKLEDDNAAWQQAIKGREKELNTAREEQLRHTEKTFNNRKNYIEKTLKYFYVGRFLHYPVESFGNGSEMVPAVFLGFIIDRKKKNPYAPSAMKLRFAIANGSKYLAMPGSYSEEIMAMIGASTELSQPGLEKLLSDWEGYTRENNVDRKIRHIVTGNLLQAFSDLKGKLVSYTTISGQVKKGILLPEHWNPGEQVQDKVVVPILKALPIIKSLTPNTQIVTNNGLSIFKTGNYFKLIISASRSKGGDIYLDKDVLQLVEKNNFEKTSDKMVAMLPEGNINNLVNVLQNNHSCSITIGSHQLKDLQQKAIISSNRKKIELPPPEQEDTGNKNNVFSLFELEAEALVLELELLAA